MTYAQILAVESLNTNEITLYYEGAFWKAYERSAFLVCEHFEKFRVSKKTVKYLNGAEIVSIGFPSVTLERLFSKYKRAVDNERRIVFTTEYVVDKAEFEAWKGGEMSPQVEVKGPRNGCDVIAEKLKKFDLATATPMDCMLFVMELKKMISNGNLSTIDMLCF